MAKPSHRLLLEEFQSYVYLFPNIYISHLIKHCLLLSIATCTCPLYVKPTLLLTEQYSAPYVMAGVISCTVCLYIVLVCPFRTLCPSTLTGILYSVVFVFPRPSDAREQ